MHLGAFSCDFQFVACQIFLSWHFIHGPHNGDTFSRRAVTKPLDNIIIRPVSSNHKTNYT